MTPKPIKNLPQSIWTKLRQKAQARGEAPNLTLQRFASERLLYRLSISERKDNFILKGAMLFAAWTEKPHRSTGDVDLLGYGEPDDLLATFRELCQVEVEPDDGVRFDPSSVDVEETREDEEYDGRRVMLKGTLGLVALNLQIDVASRADLPRPT